jgi:hypothetical protein
LPSFFHGYKSIGEFRDYSRDKEKKKDGKGREHVDTFDRMVYSPCKL